MALQRGACRVGLSRMVFRAGWSWRRHSHTSTRLPPGWHRGDARRCSWGGVRWSRLRRWGRGVRGRDRVGRRGRGRGRCVSRGLRRRGRGGADCWRRPEGRRGGGGHALCVERVGGDAGEDFGEGVLDGGAVLERGECEDGVVGVDVKVFGRAPGGLVVVVELLAAQGGRAAAMAVDVDVAAEEALAGFPWFITSECGGMGRSVKCESPARGRALFCSLF
jgi:hypothetical protein